MRIALPVALTLLVSCEAEPPGGRARLAGGTGGPSGPAPVQLFDETDIVVRYLAPDSSLFGVQVAGDLDGDGVADPAFSRRVSDTEWVWDFVSGAARGDVDVAASAIATLSGWEAANGPVGLLAIADLDADGDVDAVIARADGIAILDGPLAGPVDVATGRLVVAVDLGVVSAEGDLQLRDFDADGDLEIALQWSHPVAGHELPGLDAWIFEGPFDTVQTTADARLHVVGDLYYPVGDQPDDEFRCLTDAIPSAVGDIDGDGVGEMIIEPASSGCGVDAVVLSGDAAGEYVHGSGGVPVELSVEVGLLSTEWLGDLDADGRADLLVRGEEHLGIAGGLPPVPVEVATNLPEIRLTLVYAFHGLLPDLDGDGVEELVTSEQYDGAVPHRKVYSGVARGTTGVDAEPLAEWYLAGTAPLARVTGAAHPVIIVESAGFVGVEFPSPAP